jgi:hypothetical protein
MSDSSFNSRLMNPKYWERCLTCLYLSKRRPPKKQRVTKKRNQISQRRSLQTFSPRWIQKSNKSRMGMNSLNYLKKNDLIIIIISN